MESPLLLAGIVLVLLFIGWVLFKFFFRLLKHFILAVVLAVIVALFWYQPFSARPDPNIGKFAYGTVSNSFLGVVVADDKENGSWIIERSGMRTKYPKNKVILKDK
jgi:4-amino-4-deoxy-L-arabinose transferase-like glycosyltransferase